MHICILGYLSFLRYWTWFFSPSNPIFCSFGDLYLIIFCLCFSKSSSTLWQWEEIIMLLFPLFFSLSYRCLRSWYWATLLKIMDKKGLDSAQIIWLWTQDHIVCPSWNLVLLGMEKHWTPLRSRMPYFISSLLPTRVALSCMCHRGSGSLEVSISLATSPSFWKGVLSFLGLRCWSTIGLKPLLCILFSSGF